jgi:hypothetical protein
LKSLHPGQRVFFGGVEGREHGTVIAKCTEVEPFVWGDLIGYWQVECDAGGYVNIRPKDAHQLRKVGARKYPKRLKPT